MQIKHYIDELLFDLFPKAKNDELLLVEEAKQFFKFKNYIPEVRIENGAMLVTFDIKLPKIDNNNFTRATSLCEKGKYKQAKKILSSLIKKAPNISEYHRVFGQAISEEGDNEQAVNHLVASLRWDPENVWALLMMGNLQAKFFNDIDRAMKYYDQVLKLKPDDNIALNNIGANLMQLGKNNEARNYFEKSVEANSEYPNSYYALAVLSETEGKDYDAFNYSIKALFANKNRDQLYGLSLKAANQYAQKIVKHSDLMSIISEYADILKSKTKKDIVFEKDANIKTAAKIEIAENYNRDYHFIKYNPDYPAFEHLVMHELVHLEMIHDARQKKSNLLFISNNNHKNMFYDTLDKDLQRIFSVSHPEAKVNDYMDYLFEGINRQIFNTPIDLFIEDKLYKDLS